MVIEKEIISNLMIFSSSNPGDGEASRFSVLNSANKVQRLENRIGLKGCQHFTRKLLEKQFLVIRTA